jgi:hypothetical protein
MRVEYKVRIRPPLIRVRGSRERHRPPTERAQEKAAAANRGGLQATLSPLPI